MMAHIAVTTFLTILFFHCLNPAAAVSTDQDQFVFSGFTGANLLCFWFSRQAPWKLQLW
jgi:hypothetical protein